MVIAWTHKIVGAVSRTVRVSLKSFLIPVIPTRKPIAADAKSTTDELSNTKYLHSSVQVIEPGIVKLDPMAGHSDCKGLPGCLEQFRTMRDKLVGTYIMLNNPDKAQIVAAQLPLHEYTYDSYFAAFKRIHSGNAFREARKSDRAGYVCGPFKHRLYIPDLVEINHSKAMRTGRPMGESYQRSVEEMGGAPGRFIGFCWPECPLHYSMYWGIFKPEPGHMQGAVQVDRRLLGYVALRRNGNYGIYSMILGHGDYLRDGIMYRLHLAIVEWMLKGEHPAARGVNTLIYGGFKDGLDGLKLWKKRAQFRPAWLLIDQLSLDRGNQLAAGS